MNCSYSIDFEGPTYQCVTKTQTDLLNETMVGYVCPNYSGAWGPYTNYHSTSQLLELNLTRYPGYIPDVGTLRESQSLQCKPAWATYKLNMTYSNGLRTFSHAISDIHAL